MAAAVAAISLHALLLSLLPSYQQTLAVLAPEGSLQVELMKQSTPLSEQPTHRTTSATAEPQQDKRARQAREAIVLTVPVKQIPPAEQLTSKPFMAKPSMTKQTAPVASAAEVLVKEPAKISESIPKQTTSTALNSNKAAETSTDNQGAAAVPNHLQQLVLAHVTYPKRARRRGWQGRTELEFTVQQQAVFEITMLASSGHPILDRAAKRGLATVDSIPLSNGLYRMPVEFRLQ
ncbi:MAG: TonB family protein [Mariprofundus sp.]